MTDNELIDEGLRSADPITYNLALLAERQQIELERQQCELERQQCELER